jgi:hypothetical protein
MIYLAFGAHFWSIFNVFYKENALQSRFARRFLILY